MISTQPLQRSDAAPVPQESAAATSVAQPTSTLKPAPKEIGGREGLEPTRYGDWEKNGRCVDF